jgi:uncharacterized membrane protein
MFHRQAGRRFRCSALVHSTRFRRRQPTWELQANLNKALADSKQIGAERSALVRNMLFSALPMDAAALDDRFTLGDAENWLALGTGAVLLIVGASRRSAIGACIAVSSAPLLYRGVTGRWPSVLNGNVQPDSTKTALGGARGVHVRESIRLELPVADVYGFWRRLDNLPRFMRHLTRVTERPGGTSHWVAAGPAGLAIEWDAEVINEIENRVLAWRSLPGSDVVTAGSVNFDAVRGGRSTQVSVHLQYAPPAGKAGALLASLFGREPSQTIREDLRHFKQLLEAGEIPRATATA